MPIEVRGFSEVFCPMAFVWGDSCLCILSSTIPLKFILFSIVVFDSDVPYIHFV